PVELRSFQLWRELHPPTDSSQQSGIPFELADILRLQVRSREGELPVDHPLIKRIASSGPIPNQELRLYFKNVMARMNGPYPIRHVFYPHHVDNCMLSWEAAQLRHLLSLFQQNEAVLPAIIDCWNNLQMQKSPSLISLLALEPELLDEPPFNGMCRRDTVKLCCEIIKDQNSAVPDKSDSLVVLAWCESYFFNSLNEIVPFILHDENLRVQFLLFSLILFGRNQDNYYRIRDALYRQTTPQNGPDRARAALAVIKQSYQFKQSYHGYASANDAEIPVRRLLECMARHSREAEEHWESLYYQITAMLDFWSDFSDAQALEEVVHNLPKACDLVEQTFLPAFAGLVYLSELRGDEKFTKLLITACENAASRCQDLRLLLPKRVDEVTPQRMQRISKALEMLRHVTWEHGWSATDVLSRTNLENNLAPLCEGVRAFFSAPWSILVRRGCLISKTLANNRIDLAAEVSVMVTPVPMTEMDDIIRLLIDNVADHGDPLSLKISKGIIDGQMTLSASNVVRLREVMGGAGIALAANKAKQYNVIVNSDIESPISDLWVTTVAFPSFFDCDTTNKYA
ncbi:MAG: hypothetical protein OJI67_21470, partial [Prosthecobacter sp.]|nr:hypothetical protein [Prosthecobacter sp.]